jgi:rubrerythrin
MAKPTSAPAGQPVSPVDDRTYNLLQALTSTLEALDAYEVYAEDDPNGIFTELMDDERNHAERLLRELRDCLHPAASR